MPQYLELGLSTFGDITLGSNGQFLSHAQTIRNVVDEGILAEESGVEFFGVGEHHRADFAVSSPDMVLAVIAGRTRRIVLGSAVTVLSSDDPVRVFQRFATLHAAAHGRAEVTLGRGAFTESFPLFGYELSQYKDLFEEKLDLFSHLISGHRITWQGKMRLPLNDQCVYPPLEAGCLKTWIAVGATPDSVLRAARYNMPLMLGIIGGAPERFRPFIEIYTMALAKLGRPIQPIGAHCPGYVADTDAQAREEFWTAYKPMRDRVGTERGWPPISRSQFDVEVDRGSLYVGSAQTVARRIVATARALGISRFDMKYSTGGLSHEKLMHNIELFGGKVIPLVRAMLHDEK